MSLLLLTLASDPYDRPGHSMPWRRRWGAAEDLQPELAPPDTASPGDVEDDD